MTRLRRAGGSSSKPARRRDDPPGRGGRSAAGARAAAAARTWFVREPPRTGTPGPRPGSWSGGYSVRGSGRERESFWGPHVRPSGLGSQSVIPRPSAAAAAAAMSAARGLIKSVSRAAFSWEPTGRAQQTLAAAVSRSGVGLHSGARATATLLPARAGEGRYFVVEGEEEARVAAEVGNAEPQSPLCTTLRSGNGAARVRTVEHLLSAMEALGVDNCRVEVSSGDEIPLLDGSAQEWVEAIRGAGLCAAEDISGQKLEKLAPKIDKPVYLRKDDCFVAAFPSSQIHITYGIDFPKVEKFRGAGLIKGGSLENAMVCSMTGGWLNPPLRFDDEPCRHKILDLIGDFSLFARNGSQGFPIAHVVAYKAGHALHTSFLHHLSGKTSVDQGTLA